MLTYFLSLVSTPFKFIAAIIFGFIVFIVLSLTGLPGIVFTGCAWLAFVGLLAFFLYQHRKRPQRLAINGFGFVIFGLLAFSGIAKWQDHAPKQRLELEQKDSYKRYFAKLPDGNSLSYIVSEPSGKVSEDAAIVILHGGPGIPPRIGTINFWAQFNKTGYPVYIYDQIGVGQSSRLKNVRDYTLQRNTEDLEHFRKAIGKKKLILVGQSWGGVLATHYISQYPQNVDAMILVSPGAYHKRSSFKRDYSLTASSESPSGLFPPPKLLVAGILSRINLNAAERFASQAELGSIYDNMAADPALAYESICKGQKPDAEQLKRGVGGNYYVNLLTLDSLKKTPDIYENLKGLKTPVLIVRGDCDYLPRTVAEDYAATFRESKVVHIPDAGHMATASNPDAVAKSVNEFISTLKTRP